MLPTKRGWRGEARTALPLQLEAEAAAAQESQAGQTPAAEEAPCDLQPASAAGNADEVLPETPLFSAVGRGGNVAIVAALCGAKADINAERDGYGHTPLIKALFDASRHHYDWTKLIAGLICLKADVNKAAGGIICPINLAAQTTPEVLRAVLSAKADPNESREGAEWPLLNAVDALHGHVLVEILLLAKACVDTEVDDTTALSLCMKQGRRGCRADVARALLRAKADVNRRDTSGRTPLMQLLAVHEAWHNCVAPTVVELLRAKADVDTFDNSRQTPLLIATRCGRMSIVRQLVSAKCDVNKTGGKKELAPLHVAAQGRDTVVAAFLIERGADVHAASGEERTPIWYNDGCIPMDKLLKSAGAESADESW